MAQNIFVEFRRGSHFVQYYFCEDRWYLDSYLIRLILVASQRWIVPPLGAHITNLARLFDGGKVISLELDTRCWPFAGFSRCARGMLACDITCEQIVPRALEMREFPNVMFESSVDIR